MKFMEWPDVTVNVSLFFSFFFVMLLASHRHIRYRIKQQVAPYELNPEIPCIDWKELYPLWPGLGEGGKKVMFPILKLSCSRPPSRCASAGLALSRHQENRNKWLVRKATESQGEQQIFPKSRSLGTLRGHAESQLLLGGGANEGGSCGERADREKQCIESPVLCWRMAKPRALTCII